MSELKVDPESPIRVKVSRECYAESLVALAEECGFELFMNEECPMDIVHYQFYPSDFRVDNDQMHIHAVNENSDYDLTYRDDLPQIEGWLQANAESEDDECEVNLPEGVGELEKPDTPRPDGPANLNPNCTDESEEYDEPKADVLLTETPLTIEQYNSLDADLKETIYQKDQRINDLQSELSDCWENQKEYKNDVDRLLREKAELQEKLQDVQEERDQLKSEVEQWEESTKGMMVVPPSWVNKNERDKLKQRIEEAREKVEGVLNSEYGVGELDNALKILFEDSDEGDGECG